MKWPKKLTIIRHGQSEQNVALDLFQDNLEEILKKQKQIRDQDIKLTDIGIWQAQETGKYLATQEQYDICFVSPYVRTLQTAENIIKNLNYEIKLFEDFRIREKEFGRLHGYTTKEIQERYPEEFEDRQRDGKFYYRLPRGENYLDVGDRIHSFLDKLHRDYREQNVLVITHQVPYVMFRALFEHLNEKQILELGDVPNCGIEEFIIDTEKHPEGRLKLKEFNLVKY
ncbi:histidine phosphatase family protein [Candidatus Woesearchaeota archaeon]|nr:histidine phosphatase family protein [Candidatus Woesearchaeota archaeon]